MRHQVLILNRGQKRAPNLRSSDRIIAGLCTLLMRPARVLRSAVLLKPSNLLQFNKMLIKQKYRLLFSPKRVRRPGPKGLTKELIDAVMEMKQRNRTWGCKRIAQQISLAFGMDIDKDVVRRILATHSSKACRRQRSSRRRMCALSESGDLLLAPSIGIGSRAQRAP